MTAIEIRRTTHVAARRGVTYAGVAHPGFGLASGRAAARAAGGAAHRAADPAARRLVLADVENLLGCEPRHASASLFEIAIEGLLASIGFREKADQLVIGACPQSAVKLFGVEVPHRRVWKAGASGADRALVEAVADHDHIASRFDQVVVASGDHEFVDTLVQLNARQVHTVVVTRGGSLHGTMRIVANDVVHVPAARDLMGLALAA